MDALPIVVALDEGEQVASGLVPRRPSSLVDELDLEVVEEALHRGINVTIAGSAHGGRRLPVGELGSVGLGRVLAAAIRVADEAVPPRPCHWVAIIRDCVCSVRMWLRMDQPTILRVARARTAAR